jgi:hypothetical protein
VAAPAGAGNRACGRAAAAAVVSSFVPVSRRTNALRPGRPPRWAPPGASLGGASPPPAPGAGPGLPGTAAGAAFPSRGRDAAHGPRLSRPCGKPLAGGRGFPWDGPLPRLPTGCFLPEGRVRPGAGRRRPGLPAAGPLRPRLGPPRKGRRTSEGGHGPQGTRPRPHGKPSMASQEPRTNTGAPSMASQELPLASWGRPMAMAFPGGGPPRPSPHRSPVQWGLTGAVQWSHGKPSVPLSRLAGTVANADALRGDGGCPSRALHGPAAEVLKQIRPAPGGPESLGPPLALRPGRPVVGGGPPPVT